MATRFHATATDMQQSDWTANPLKPCSWDASQYEAKWNHLKKDIAEHNIRLTLSASDRKESNRITSVRIIGQSYPSGQWGGLVSYSVTAHHGPDELGAFGMAFIDRSQPGRSPGGRSFVLRLPPTPCETEIRKGNLYFVFSVTTRESKLQPISVVNEKVRAYLASPEALRETSLQELAALESRVRKVMETGLAWKGVINWARARAEDPARMKPARPEDSLDPAVKTEALNALLKEVERRRQLIRDHYREIHAAAHRSFPILTSIDAKPSMK